MNLTTIIKGKKNKQTKKSDPKTLHLTFLNTSNRPRISVTTQLDILLEALAIQLNVRKQQINKQKLNRQICLNLYKIN